MWGTISHNVSPFKQSGHGVECDKENVLYGPNFMQDTMYQDSKVLENLRFLAGFGYLPSRGSPTLTCV